MPSSQNIQSGSDMVNFINQLKDDLRVATEFYQMWRRRNGHAGDIGGVPAAFASEEPAKTRKARGKVTKIVKATRKPRKAAAKPVEKAPKAPRGEIKRSILKAISKCSTQYTVRDVQSALVSDGLLINSTTISIMLGKLTKDALVNRVQEGSGRKPAIYRQLTTASATVPMKVEADVPAVAFPDPDPV